jgi:hypothetical protein
MANYEDRFFTFVGCVPSNMKYIDSIYNNLKEEYDGHRQKHVFHPVITRMNDSILNKMDDVYKSKTIQNALCFRAELKFLKVLEDNGCKPLISQKLINRCKILKIDAETPPPPPTVHNSLTLILLGLLGFRRQPKNAADEPETANPVVPDNILPLTFEEQIEAEVQKQHTPETFFDVSTEVDCKNFSFKEFCSNLDLDEISSFDLDKISKKYCQCRLFVLLQMAKEYMEIEKEYVDKLKALNDRFGQLIEKRNEFLIMFCKELDGQLQEKIAGEKRYYNPSYNSTDYYTKSSQSAIIDAKTQRNLRNEDMLSMLPKDENPIIPSFLRSIKKNSKDQTPSLEQTIGILSSNVQNAYNLNPSILAFINFVKKTYTIAAYNEDLNIVSELPAFNGNIHYLSSVDSIGTILDRIVAEMYTKPNTFKWELKHFFLIDGNSL